MAMSRKPPWSIYALFLVCGIAQAAIVPLLPRLSSTYGLSPSETGLLLALPGLATLAVSVPAGVLADRIGARRCTVIAGAVLAVSCLAQAAPSLAALLAGRALFGVAYGVVWTTGVAWLAQIDAEHGGSRVGPSVTCASVGVMLGPAIGGVLAGAGATALPFLLIAAASTLVMMRLTLGGARTRRAAAEPVAATSGPVSDAAGLARARGRSEAAELARAVSKSETAQLARAVSKSEAAEPARTVSKREAAELARAVSKSETAELARAVSKSESAELARAVGYSEAAELASSYGYGEPVPYGGGGRGRMGELMIALRRPGVVAATGALAISGAVSSVSQLLISGGLHHDGLSIGRIGLAFSLAAVSYIAVSLAVVRLGERAHTLRFNALATTAMALVLVPALVSNSATVLILTLMVASMPRAAASTVSYSLASSRSAANAGTVGGSSDGSVFGVVNGAWAGSQVLMPLLAGLLEEHGGAQVGYLAVIIPAMVIAFGLMLRSRPRAVGAQATILS
jgi:MFS family permease